MLEILYNLIIQPLVFLVDLIFSIIYNKTGSPTFSVILLSVIVNFVALPLYRQADSIQKEQQDKQNKMQRGVDHIRSTFKGDEQYMMLSAYYRIEKYHPLSVLKESFPLLLQIPIFIAAYRYLSSAHVLSGASFGPILSLGNPDALLTIGGFSVNVLPIVMTALNLLSGFVYAKNQPIRQKIQIVGIALIFLVLLYNSPSGLVLYWTTSQVFSLCKNLFLETNVLRKRPVVLAFCFIVLFASVIGMSTSTLDTPAEVFTSEVLLILAVVQLIRIILDLKNAKPPAFIEKLKQYDRILPECRFRDLLIVELCGAVLYGVVIPSSVLSVSATEFVDSSSGKFLTELLTYPASIYIGLFLIWVSVFYYFSGKKGKKTLFSILLALLGVSLLNYFAFDVKPDFYYADLSFDKVLDIPVISVILNLLLSVAVACAAIIAWKKNNRIARSIAGIIAVALIALGGYNIAQIPSALAEASLHTKSDSMEDQNKTDMTLTLSKAEENVIVFMLDRVMGAYIPYILEEKPELKEAFDGFTFYPNTVSYGPVTIYGAPPLYGGYEYTPEALIKNDEKSVKEQRLEAFRVLPVLFSENGFRTTVTDPALFDVSLYDDYPDIQTINLVGQFNDSYVSLFEDSIRPIQRRNFAVFSIYRTVPLFLRKDVYADGSYLNVNKLQDAYTQAFIDNYAALKAMPKLMTGDDSEHGSFLLLQNATAHEPVVLEAPDYSVRPQNDPYDIPYGERTVEGRTMNISSLSDWKQYSVTAATLMALAEWIDALKELGVYDNTRIILVADHGAASSSSQFPDLVLPNDSGLVMYNPMLMVKEFHARGALTTSNEFMTNADVAELATQGVVDNPVNPFTGNSFSSNEKENGVLIKGSLVRETGNVDSMSSMADYKWWRVKENIFDLNNWEFISGEAAE